jgi:GMP synthase (glutamine-hydrolysing)
MDEAMNKENCIAIIDCGSQTTMLIARRVREQGVLFKIFGPDAKACEIIKDKPSAIILSGGPHSLLDQEAIRIDGAIFHLDIPTLGICYGMQLMVEHFGGKILKATKGEFGRRPITITEDSSLFAQVDRSINVWMSHCDQIDLNTTEFRTIAHSDSCPQAAIESKTRPLFGVQFHPEVTHCEQGDKILRNFIFDVAKAPINFALGDYIEEKVLQIKEEVKDGYVIMGLSGGLDSTVAALLIHKAIGDRLHCVYVDHGLHRQGEVREVISIFGDVFKMDLHVIDAKEQFLKELRGVVDPEEKRQKIGKTFIDIFEQEAERFGHASFLGQGTLYPDVIESLGKKSGASAIKSHHNVGGLPERMKLKLIEPLRYLFKDEVRNLASLLGLDDKIKMRQPFPGPGLAVRIPGEVTLERLDLLKKADLIVRDEIEKAIARKDVNANIWQYFAILLPVKSVGVMGDARSFGETIVIRCVNSEDGMTADWCMLPRDLLQCMSSRITNEVLGISRVLYDVTQKPPGTIEWE